MKKTKTILAATVAAFAVCGMAKADSEYNVDGFTVLANNWQYNWSTVFARAVFSGFNIAGDFKASTVSIGNNWISETDGSTRILNQQTQLADLGSTTKGPLTNVGGNVDLSAATICNNASMTTGKSGKVSIDNVQKCNTTDPFAVVGLAGNSIGGNIDLSATTIANNVAIDAETAGGWFGNTQANPANVYAAVEVDLNNVGGDVNATVAAVGNNATFKTKFTP